MKGLLIKDWYLIKKLCRMVILMDVILAAFSLIDLRNQFFSYYCCLMTGITPITLIAYDEQAKWDVYAGTLPYTRAQLVSVKYLVSLLASAFILLLLAVPQALMRVSKGSFVPVEYFSYFAVLASFCLFLPALALPLVFRFGSEKGRLVNMLMVGAACGISVFFATSGVFSHFTFDASLLSVLFLVIAALLYLASWRLSIRLYTKREL